jgi:hypothetical protein
MSIGFGAVTIQCVFGNQLSDTLSIQVGNAGGSVALTVAGGSTVSVLLPGGLVAVVSIFDQTTGSLLITTQINVPSSQPQNPPTWTVIDGALLFPDHHQVPFP